MNLFQLLSRSESVLPMELRGDAKSISLDLSDNSTYEKFRLFKNTEFIQSSRTDDKIIVEMDDENIKKIADILNSGFDDLNVEDPLEPFKSSKPDDLEIVKEEPREPQDKRVLVVNLFGGPGVGKSTLAMRLASDLKMLHVETEYVSEYAKDLVYENRSLTDQIMIFAEQNRRIKRLTNPDSGVKVVICDAPILLSVAYEEFRRDKGFYVKSEHFAPFMVDVFNGYKNLNILLKRDAEDDYSIVGRKESAEESEKVDRIITNVLNRYHIPYMVKSRDARKDILNKILAS